MTPVASRDERIAAPARRPEAAIPAVQLVGVEKSYGLLRPRSALRGVSLRIERGECYGLAGPNGAGKTTLIKVMLGLVAPDAGEARLLGLRPDFPEVRRRVGFVPEAAELPPGASPLQLVRRWARLRGLPMRRAAEQGEANLRRLAMAELLDRPVHRFSKGEKQRTLVALSLLGEPELLVLDEPTDGLDPNQRRDTLALIARLGKERTVILSTHILPEVESVCARVVILDRGRIIAEGRPAELVDAERDLIVVARGEPEAILAAARAVDGVLEVTAQPGDAYRVKSARDVREALSRAILAVAELRELRPAALGLERVFQQLTARPVQS